MYRIKNSEYSCEDIMLNLSNGRFELSNELLHILQFGNHNFFCKKNNCH